MELLMAKPLEIPTHLARTCGNDTGNPSAVSREHACFRPSAFASSVMTVTEFSGNKSPLDEPWLIFLQFYRGIKHSSQFIDNDSSLFFLEHRNQFP